MTPAQLNHLSRLKRHLETLLATAEKRTPGEWGVEQTDTTNWIGPMRHDGDKIDVIVCDTDREDLKFYALQRNDHNAAYIASCAGNAEAGWRSTLAAIDLCIANLHTDPEFPTHAPDHICDNDGQGCRACGYTERILLDSILAAWPIEKLP